MSRYAVVLAAVVMGCAQQPQPLPSPIPVHLDAAGNQADFTPEQRAAYRRLMGLPAETPAEAERNLRITAQEEAQRREARQATQARAQQAAIICRARGNLAMTQPAYGGPGWAGALGAGLQLGWAGANAEEICLATYQATGIMPTY